MKITKLVSSFLLALMLIFIPSSISNASNDNIELNHIIENNLINQIDKFIKIDKNNKFIIYNPIELKKLLNYNLEEANKILNNSKTILNKDELFDVIQNRITLINKSIDYKQIRLQFDKQIISEGQISKNAYGYSDWEHELRSYWWGSKHIYRTNRAATSHASSIRKLSVGTGLGMLVPGMAVPAGITTAYLNLMADSITTAKSLYSKSYMDVTIAFVYKTGQWNGN